MPTDISCRAPIPSVARAGRFVFSSLVVALATGCAPYFYEGKAAVIDESSGFEVTRKDRSWGDCYFKLRKMPTVYQLGTERYTITITQGPRYWPEFFLEVVSSEGLELELSGMHIERLDALHGGDLRRLREARRTNPTHKTVKLTEVPNGEMNVEVIDDGGKLIGEHVLEFALIDVNCFGWDAI